MKVIDKRFTQCSAMGVRQMVDFLRGKGYNVGKKLVRRLMNLMDLRAIYPMKSLSKGGWVKYRMPYLLRNLLIDRPNQVWCTDITYVAMEHGFMYLYAIIDVYSRYIVGWGLYNSLDASNATEVLDAAVRRHCAPENNKLRSGLSVYEQGVARDLRWVWSQNQYGWQGALS